MILSNVHLAYGDDSVFQQLVVEDPNTIIKDGDVFSEWVGLGVKIRAVKNRNNTYTAIVRDSDGALKYEGINTHQNPTDALEEARFWFEGNA